MVSVNPEGHHQCDLKWFLDIDHVYDWTNKTLAKGIHTMKYVADQVLQFLTGLTIHIIFFLGLEFAYVRALGTCRSRDGSTQEQLVFE
jgi:hypothetical protein